MKLKATSRGFLRADFKDANNEDCSIQESSIADGRLIWLGMNRGTHVHIRGYQGGDDCLARMHINRKLARQLVPLLQRFIDQGDLRRPKRKGTP